MPELLAPAGDRASLEAAVRNGADAVYFGARSFNARARAGNFDGECLKDAIDYARLRGVRPYLALNTLLHDEELDEAEAIACQAYEAGIEAAIVQDFGLARRLRRRLPGLPLHASTQATVSDAVAVRAACALGFSRIILPRELSVPEIAALTRVAAEADAGIEVFVHGALCFCLSGQCRMSALIGGRSGNRGECAQPCRLAYKLEGADRDADSSASARPLLSPKDLTALALLPELVAAGVAALKIEGRMRSAAYVGQVVSVFRRRLDLLAQQGPDRVRLSSAEEAADMRRLLLAFNRGGAFTDAYLRGQKGPGMMAGTMAGSHGLLLGRVHAVKPEAGILEIHIDDADAAAPGAGDILSVRDPSSGEEKASAPCATAAPVACRSDGRLLAVKGFHPEVLRTFQVGDPVHRMNDEAADRELHKSDRRRTPLVATFDRNSDGCCHLDVHVAHGPSSHLSAAAVEETPRDGSMPALDADRLREQLGRTGETPFRIEEVRILAEPRLPVSALNALRRMALDRLSEALRSSFRRTAPPPTPASPSPSARSSLRPAQVLKALWTISVEPSGFDGSPEGVACGADAYYLPAPTWLSADGRECLRALQEREPRAALFAVMPPAARGDFALRLRDVPRLVAESGGKGVVCANPGMVALASTLGLFPVAGPDANLWNAHSVSVFAAFGAQAASPSVELDPRHVAAICLAAAGEGVDSEPAVYGRQRLMAVELCPVGHSRPGCTLCRRGPASLRDRTGASFPVVCHPEDCTASILNACILSIPREALAFREAGATRLRLCFHEETPEERRSLVDLHRRLATQADAERIRGLAAAIARRTGSRLTRGPQ